MVEPDSAEPIWKTRWKTRASVSSSGERQSRLGGDHDVGHVGVAGAARFDHRDVGRVDEDVAVVALELHQVRLPPLTEHVLVLPALPD